MQQIRVIKDERVEVAKHRSVPCGSGTIILVQIGQVRMIDVEHADVGAERRTSVCRCGLGPVTVADKLYLAK